MILFIKYNSVCLLFSAFLDAVFGWIVSNRDQSEKVSIKNNKHRAEIALHHRIHRRPAVPLGLRTDWVMNLLDLSWEIENRIRSLLPHGPNTISHVPHDRSMRWLFHPALYAILHPSSESLAFPFNRSKPLRSSTLRVHPPFSRFSFCFSLFVPSISFLILLTPAAWIV